MGKDEADDVDVEYFDGVGSADLDELEVVEPVDVGNEVYDTLNEEEADFDPEEERVPDKEGKDEIVG